MPFGSVGPNEPGATEHFATVGPNGHAQVRRRKPGAGRPKGSQNARTIAIAEVARSLVEDHAYRATLLERMRNGKISPPMEITLWFYAYGRPVENVRVEHVQAPATMTDAELHAALLALTAAMGEPLTIDAQATPAPAVVQALPPALPADPPVTLDVAIATVKARRTKPRGKRGRPPKARTPEARTPEPLVEDRDQDEDAAPDF
jgi:hypothetical protein